MSALSLIPVVIRDQALFTSMQRPRSQFFRFDWMGCAGATDDIFNFHSTAKECQLEVDVQISGDPVPFSFDPKPTTGEMDISFGLGASTQSAAAFAAGTKWPNDL